jgi:cytochrome c oxidase subunit 2
MEALFIVLTVALILIIIIMVAKTLEYVSVLQGEEKSQKQANKVNATFLLFFLIFGLIGLFYCNNTLKDKLLPQAASLQGEVIDHMMLVTLVVTGIVLFGTQITLFVAAWYYKRKPGRKATYYPQWAPQNERLEIIWTSVTLLALMVLIIFGLKQWFKITGPAPKDAMLVEVTGKQFNWIFRYPGHDGELGPENYRLIDPAKSNPLGQDWTDSSNKDDVVSNGEMHLVVNRPVKLLIHSQDVIHDVGLPYFRLKMDAVPGIPTTLWFTPTITSARMKQITGDPNFVYELACDQICGNGHYSMRGTIIVQTQQEFNQWVASQQSQYAIAMSEQHNPSDSTKGSPSPPAGDSTRPLARR